MKEEKKYSDNEPIEPDKRKIYMIDGMKATVNFFFPIEGKSAAQSVEDYIVKQSAKRFSENC